MLCGNCSACGGIENARTDMTFHGTWWYEPRYAHARVFVFIAFTRVCSRKPFRMQSNTDLYTLLYAFHYISYVFGFSGRPQIAGGVDENC